MAPLPFMLDLICHVVKISSRRDRTEINSAVVGSLVDLFDPLRLTIYRCYPSRCKTILFACAGLNENGKFVHNAYLPDKRYCYPSERDALLHRCCREMSAVIDMEADGSHRIVFPVTRLDEPLYLIDLVLPESFSADRRVALMGLIEYFGNHLALLDYGETDTLTGLANRKTFDKHLAELLGNGSNDELVSTPEARRKIAERGSHWLAVCDIDHFKGVNDNFGHLVGDEVLITIAQIMRDSFRIDDQLFRFGGEEFIIVLQPASQEAAFATLERFRQNVETQAFDRIGHVTISVGFSALRTCDTPTDAIDRADEALYHAKRSGRNRIACYEELVATGSLPPEQPCPNEVECL